jgi:hypothetical protein
MLTQLKSKYLVYTIVNLSFFKTICELMCTYVYVVNNYVMQWFLCIFKKICSLEIDLDFVFAKVRIQNNENILLKQ